jgi:molecular chaperone DnaK (HSP70)
MPQVRDRLVNDFGIEPEIYDPDEAVAKGAALFGLKEALQDQVREILAPQHAEGNADPDEINLTAVSEAEISEALDRIEQATGFTLTGPVRELVSTQIVNVLSKSLGVVARNEEGKDVVVYLLPRNSEVPMEQTADFGTDQPNQEGVEIKVMAGERDSPDPLDCKDVGTATLDLPPALPARSPVRVTFAISRDGRLDVSAVDLTGGGSIRVEFETEAVMRADEVAERSTALRLLNVS